MLLRSHQVSAQRMFELGFKVLCSYLLGSMIGSLIVGQLRGGIDIRTMGSGNAGGTNALRTQGAWFAVCVMLIDIGKGWLATALLPSWHTAWLPLDASVDRGWLTVACAGAVVLGHVYPVWYGFRGGKGAATLLGVVVGLLPIALPIVLAVWLVTVMLSGFVGLATILAVTSFSFYLMFARIDNQAWLSFGIGMAIFTIYTHRANISRMRSGTENRVQRLWLLRPRS
jgi:glycerol-3-phosphate acyltransferase PlsY